MDSTAYICTVAFCGERSVARGYCRRHYSQWKRHGRIISAERMLGPRVGQRKKGGYIYFLRPEHPNADKRGYVKRSWLVWEENTGHTVTPPEVIHHKNKIRDDDRFENLELVSNKSAHVKEHGGRIGGIRIVTKEMAKKEMLRVYSEIGRPFTTRRFTQYSHISADVIKHKFGWNNMKEELCIP